MSFSRATIDVAVDFPEPEFRIEAAGRLIARFHGKPRLASAPKPRPSQRGLHDRGGDALPTLFGSNRHLQQARKVIVMNGKRNGTRANFRILENEETDFRLDGADDLRESRLGAVFPRANLHA